MSAETPTASWRRRRGGGSQAAFREIVARHQQAVRSFLRRALDEPADADDLAQETFLAAWTSLWRYPRPGVAALLALRHRLEEARSPCALAAAGSESGDGARTPPAPAGASPDQRARPAARRCASLPEAQRAAVALCLGGGFSHAEAAEALGLPIGTIKSHVERGRARLVAALGDEP